MELEWPIWLDILREMSEAALWFSLGFIVRALMMGLRKQ